MIVNFAERAHNHNWELDPVIRSLLDRDFYKLLMLRFIWKHYAKTRVLFALFNRTSWVRPGRHIRDQGDCRAVGARSKIAVSKIASGWLAGNTFYGRRGIFEPAFLDGWSRISNCRTMRYPSTTASSICPSKAIGQKPPCGNFMRCLSWMSLGREPI
jgi:nicotinate phosphoribosyltransferase